MNDHNEEYFEKIAKINQRFLVAVNNDFTSLEELVYKLDPIRLIAALTLRHLCHPTGQRIEEGNPINEWSIKVEFLTGLLAANLTEETKANNCKISEEEIIKVEALLTSYFDNTYQYISTKKPDDDSPQSYLMFTSKLYSLSVRGESYPSKILDAAQKLYSEHDSWFEANLGFTINDAISLSNMLIKMNDLAANCVFSLTEVGHKVEDIPLENFFLFEATHLSKLSGLDLAKCSAFMKRFCQDFGYKNAKHPNTFSSPQDAPWDFNTLYERPIIRTSSKYFVPLTCLLPVALLHSFYFDLIKDKEYYGVFSNKIGNWLERQVSSCLKRIFNENEVHENIFYDFNGKKEEVDVLLKHDTKLLIFQCKFKRLTHETKIGSSTQQLEVDFDKSVGASMQQCLKAKKYVESSDSVKFYKEQVDLKFKKGDVEEVILINIVFGDYAGHSIQTEKINQAFQLWDSGEYSWTIPFLDFDMVTEMFDNPYSFLHYVTRRIETEKVSKDLMVNDEMELLGFYFKQGLWLDSAEFKNATGLLLSGFSDSIDDYMHKKYFLKQKTVPKPKQEMPANFEKLLMTIDTLAFPGKIDCILSLLDLDHNGRIGITELFEQTKSTTLKDGRRHTCSFMFSSKSGGVCFVAEPCGGNLEQLFQDVSNLTAAKKQSTKSSFWIGLGYDSLSNHFVDLIVFIKGPNLDDPLLDKRIEESLKNGSRAVELKEFIKKHNQ